MRKYFCLMAMAIIAIGFTACIDDNPAQQGSQTSGIDMSNLDTSVRPGDDFYQYACGGWIKNNPLPAAYSRYGSLEKMVEENQKRLKTILDDLQAGNFAAGSTEQKLADLYRMAMDSQRRNQQGVEPLMGIISQMEQATTVEQLFQIHLQLVPEKFYAFLITNFVADEKNAKMNILKVKQSGIGMEQKEYYLDNAAATVDIREAYKQTIIKMFRRFGFNEQQASQKMANVIQCQRFWTAENVRQKAGKPVDPAEWQMTPQTVNAYYEPTTNEICFPAGILQPPFFDMEADDAINYGAIGVVIGHEMTHGFDDEGRLYDKDGNLHEWWTPDDAAKFQEKANMYADFFDAIEVLPGLHANGRMTLGENLADHGGLLVAWTAYKNATQGQPLPVIDGLTADQRFFLSYAHIWAQNITEAEIRRRTTGDLHSLGRWRVNGALPHIDAWYEAFGVKEDDKLYIPKEKRLELW